MAFMLSDSDNKFLDTDFPNFIKNIKAPNFYQDCENTVKNFKSKFESCIKNSNQSNIRQLSNDAKKLEKKVNNLTLLEADLFKYMEKVIDLSKKLKGSWKLAGFLLISPYKKVN